MERKLLLFTLPLFLISCVSAPKTKKISVGEPAPDKWSAGETVAGQIDSTWWMHFGDARLDSLVDEALLKNFNLQAAAASLDAAVAQAKIAGASRFPQLNAGMTASRVKQNFIGLPIPFVTEKVLTSTNTIYSPSLNFSWELDLWGRIRSGQSAALADVEASQAELAGAKLSVTAQVVKTWFAAIESRRQVELVRATAESYRLSSEQIQDRYERGLRRALEVRLALSNLAASEAMLSQIRHNMRLSSGSSKFCWHVTRALRCN